LIDGRFRVACCLQTLLSTKSHVKIAIHDFYIRPDYYIVLKYVKVIFCADTLVVVKPKLNMDKDSLIDDLLLFRFDTR
jgi:hypothetical protein